MFKKGILIFICLALLISCGRKNEPKYEASIINNEASLNNQNKIFIISEENEIYK